MLGRTRWRNRCGRRASDALSVCGWKPCRGKGCKTSPRCEHAGGWTSCTRAFATACRSTTSHSPEARYANRAVATTNRYLARRSRGVCVRQCNHSNGIEPAREARGQRPSNRKALAQINLHWHDLRHEALSRLADDGVPVHELQLLAGHASITTTQRYMNARANSLAESMRQAPEHARIVSCRPTRTCSSGLK